MLIEPSSGTGGSRGVLSDGFEDKGGDFKLPLRKVLL